MTISRNSTIIFLEQWNWKAALLSAVFRAPVFLVTTFSYGWHSTTLAVGVEAVYRTATAGIFAGFIQSVRNKRPIWLAVLLITVMCRLS